jgi:hypothetical protein
MLALNSHIDNYFVKLSSDKMTSDKMAIDKMIVDKMTHRHLITHFDKKMTHRAAFISRLHFCI